VVNVQTNDFRSVFTDESDLHMDLVDAKCATVYHSGADDPISWDIMDMIGNQI